MKKINYLKFALSTIIAIIFTLLFNKMILGMEFHEIAGLAIGVLVLVHCGLNWRWIRAVTVKLFSKETTVRTKIVYIIDLLLIINFFIIIVTGSFMSKFVFASLGSGGAQALKPIHVSVAYFSLAFIGVHLGLHWNWVMSVFKKIFRIPEKKVITYISRAMAVVVLIFGVYSTYSVKFLSKISFTNTESRGNGQFGPGNGMQRGNGRFNSDQMPNGGDENFDPSQMPDGGNFDPSQVPSWGNGDSGSNQMPSWGDGDSDSNQMPSWGNGDSDSNQMPQGGNESSEEFVPGQGGQDDESSSDGGSATEGQSTGNQLKKLSSGTTNGSTQGGQARRGRRTQQDGQGNNQGRMRGNFNGNFNGNFPGGDKVAIGSTNALGTIASYLGVISMFAVVIYYIEKLIKSIKKKKNYSYEAEKRELPTAAKTQ